MTRVLKITRVVLLGFALLNCLQPISAQFIGFEILNRNGRATFSFEKVNNLVVIPVMLNDILPLNFILDTGVRTTILTDKAISDIINISYDRSVTITGAGHIRELNAFLASNVSLSLPGISGKGQSLIVLEEDYLELRNHLGMNVHGIIGYEFFNHFVVLIDYDRKLITVYDPDVFKPRKRFAAIPFSMEQGRPYITATITQQDGTVFKPKLLIDSGASHGLLLETDTDENIKLPEQRIRTIIGWGLGGELSGYLARVPHVTIDRFDFKNVMVSFADNYSDEEVTRITRRNGSIGGDLLNRFTVIFDYPHGMIYLQKNRFFSYPFEFNLGGLDLIATGEDYSSFKVINVIENSPAAEAGILIGDQIIAINGKFTSDLSLSEINTQLRSRPGTRMIFVINRNSQIKKISFKLKRMI